MFFKGVSKVGDQTSWCLFLLTEFYLYFSSSLILCFPQMEISDQKSRLVCLPTSHVFLIDQ